MSNQPRRPVATLWAKTLVDGRTRSSYFAGVMLPELGHFALILALFVALYQTFTPMLGARLGDRGLAASAHPAALAQLFLVLIAFACLTAAHVGSDFSVLNVVQNSHTDKPLVYKFSGVWGNHEGSMVLWVVILALFGGVLAWRGREDDLTVMTLAVQGAVASAFLAFLILTSNPFTRVFPAPANGQDLNPLLQDPGLALHPPFLYLGYVGFSIVFAFAVAALIRGEVDRQWAIRVRPWALASWVFLTIGIALGAWWAYYELGWGGFWAWDPVENASLMPWLAGVALIHSIRVLEKRDTLKVWTVLLAILAFSLSLVGTFLVRSGILTSIHAFAVDPTRGVFILLILVAAIGGSLLLFALRAPTLKSDAYFEPASREGAIILNNLLLSAACVAVFLGTFYPLFVDIITGDRLTVGAPYFNTVFSPLVLVTLFALAPVAGIAWRRDNIAGRLRALWPAALVAGVLLIIGAAILQPRNLIGLAAGGLALWTIFGVLQDLARRLRVRAGERSLPHRLATLPKGYLGMSIAHLGVAIVTFGVIGAAIWKTERVLYMQIGDELALGGAVVQLARIEDVPGPNYESLQAAFSVRSGEAETGAIIAERRYYPVRGMQTTEAGIRTKLSGDLYITIGALDPERGLVVRAWRRPLAVWMWIGSAFIALGGIVAGWPARVRKTIRDAAPQGAAPGVAE